MIENDDAPEIYGLLELLSQTVEEISGELALEPLLQRILERAQALLGAGHGLIALYSPLHNAVRTVVTSCKTFEVDGASPYPGQTLVERILSTGTVASMRFRDLSGPLAEQFPDNWVIGMPIRVRDGLIGAFCVGLTPADYLDERKKELLSLFARHAAIAISNAHRYSHEQRRAYRFALIANITAMAGAGLDLETLLQRAADAIHETMGYTSVDIPLIDPENPGVLIVLARSGRHRAGRLEVRLPIALGIMGAAVRECRIQLVNDARNDSRYIAPPGGGNVGAELAIPIRHGDEVLGVLNIEGDDPFDELDRVSLEVVAEHMAIVVVNNRLREQSRQIAVLEERQRLARDLHDNVTQILASISLITQSLTEAWRIDAAEGRRLAARLSDLSQLAFAELRGMLQELSCDRPEGHAAAPPVDLPDSLQRLLRIMVPANIRLDFEVLGYSPQSAQHEEALLRTCQEAVSNAVRHAAPQRIEMSIELTDTDVFAVVTDDGSGIAKDAKPGMGLNNMRWRLQELGGMLCIAARHPRGTRISARLPRYDRLSD